ncbi:tetratricopeptide repeat protein, partial [Anaerocolumna jejuensis]|uniref:tetratricopeptide repeat protein n=1 Tax=Anaerocolumna jejuensis TaxID=259063 RepID=UPI003F7C01B2
DTSDNKQYISYQIGKSYYMIEDYGNARKYFEEAMQYNLRPELNYVQDLVETYGYSLINTGKNKEAMSFLDIYDEFSGSADFLFLIAHILLNNEYYVEAINEFLKAAQVNKCKVVGVNGYLSYYNIGVIYECLGEKSKAIYYYRKSIGYYPAEDRLKQLL